MPITKLSTSPGPAGMDEGRKKINEIIDDAGGDFSGGGGGGSAYSTGWLTSHGSVTVANGSTHTITHNLGTTDVLVQVFVNSSASDTNAQLVKDLHAADSGKDFGCTTTSLGSNTVTLQLAGNLIVYSPK